MARARRGSRHRSTLPGALDPAQLDRARPASLPTRLAPQLPTSAETPPDGERWLHELKLDGYRLLAFRQTERLRLLTRRGQDWTDRFPSIARQLQRLPVSQAIIDGEVVVLAADGTSDFQALQNSLSGGEHHRHVYFAFDLPFCDGYDLTRCRLLDRKRLLARLLAENAQPQLRLSEHVEGHGPTFYEHACGHGVEGVVSKRVDSGYQGRRSRSWLKIKCLATQEFVVVGYTPPNGSRQHFGALLLASYEGDRLVYCGRVGTGFTDASLRELAARLRPLHADRRSLPPDQPPRGAAARHVTWVRPELVAAVRFAGWTEGGILRHASFQGLRDDKAAREVVRDEPAVSAADTAARASPRRSAAPSGARPASASATRQARSTPTLPSLGVRLTNPQRILYPQQGISKQELAEYYLAIRDWVLPYVSRRPLTVVRCPSGQHADCFYQKHMTESVSAPIRPVQIGDDPNEKYLSIVDLPGLITLVQLGVLEIHPWGSRVDRLDRPDQIVFDLDPGEQVSWTAVLDGARQLRELLAHLGLASFVRTTGGKGLHVVVPLARRTTWPDVKQFAQHVAIGMTRRFPAHYVATSTRSKRAGRIYIDYLRNNRGSTSIASYSTRARPAAPVAVPLAWNELDQPLDPMEFTLRTVPDRLARLGGDPWADFHGSRQNLSRAAQRQAREFAR